MCGNRPVHNGYQLCNRQQRGIREVGCETVRFGVCRIVAVAHIRICCNRFPGVGLFVQQIFSTTRVYTVLRIAGGKYSAEQRADLSGVCHVNPPKEI